MVKKVALDVDGTIAASLETVFDELGTNFGYEDVESWQWPIEKFDTDEFINTFDYVWMNRWEDIPLAEEGLPYTMEWLYDYFEVDIVTAQAQEKGITIGKKNWLQLNHLVYDDFVTVSRDQTKARLPYDIYIDDKPTLPEKVNRMNTEAEVYLRDRPYNKEAEGEYTRIGSVEEALKDNMW